MKRVAQSVRAHPALSYLCPRQTIKLGGLFVGENLAATNLKSARNSLRADCGRLCPSLLCPFRLFFLYRFLRRRELGRDTIGVMV